MLTIYGLTRNLAYPSSHAHIGAGTFQRWSFNNEEDTYVEYPHISESAIFQSTYFVQFDFGIFRTAAKGTLLTITDVFLGNISISFAYSKQDRVFCVYHTIPRSRIEIKHHRQ